MCRFRTQKLSPSSLLENSAFLINPAGDALKLSSNRSEENLTGGPFGAAGGAGGVGSPQHKNPHDGPPYTTLPITELEHIQRAVAVFLCLHGYLSLYVFPGEPQNEVKSPQLEKLPALSSFGNIPTAGKAVVAIPDPIDIGECSLSYLGQLAFESKALASGASIELSAWRFHDISAFWNPNIAPR